MNSCSRILHAAGVGGVMLLAAPSAHAQQSLLPTASWGAAPSYTMWQFSTPLALDGFSLRSASQTAVPLRAAVQLGRVGLDASGAIAMSRVEIDDPDGTSRELTLNGMTDLRVRARVPLIGDGVVLTLGVNLPTGTTSLDADQSAALQVVAAPAMRFGVASFGAGLGATGGFVAARQVGDWAFGAGATVEHRSEYTPIEIALQSGTSTTTLEPGLATHVTLAADRPIGAHRVSFLVVGDVYSTDALRTSEDAAPTEYTLGPQVSAMTHVDLGLAAWRQASFDIGVRHRTPFKDAAGETVEGSDATYLEASFGGVRGRALGRGLIAGVDARWHSGMTATASLVGAAVSAAGATLGVELPFARSLLRLAVRGEYASFDTGAATGTGTSISIVGVVAARRAAQ